MSGPWLLPAGLALAATIGWSVNEGGLCAVAATRELVAGRPPRLLAGSVQAFATAGLAGIALLAIFLGLWLVTFTRLRRDDVHLAERRWPLAVAMLVLSVAGATLYAFAPGWTWSDAIRQHLPFTMAMDDGGAGTALAMATVSGSIAAALSERRFRARRPGWLPLARSLLGGWIMAIGATMVPGGNDSLLLAAIPAGSLSGVTAYLVMVVTVAGLLAVPMVAGRK